MELAPHTQLSEPAFITYINGKVSPFTYAKFSTNLRNTLNNAGINPENYSGHSFRRGGATFAMRAGVPFPLIKCQGDWASDAFERYLTTTLQDPILAVAMTAKAIKNTKFQVKIFYYHDPNIAWRFGGFLLYSFGHQLAQIPPNNAVVHVSSFLCRYEGLDKKVFILVLTEHMVSTDTLCIVLISVPSAL